MDSSVTSSEAREQAARAVALTRELGDVLEQLACLGCIVSLEVWHNDGAESILLHRLNGEFELEVGCYHRINGMETQ